MKAEIKNGSLILTLPLQAPSVSKSGKTLVVASTHGNVSAGIQVDGKDLTVGVNAYVYAQPK